MLPSLLPITLARGPVDFTLAVPGSKSITNRYLIMSALAGGEVRLSGLLRSDDTEHMLAALRTLGFVWEADWPALSCRVMGRGGVIPAAGADLFLGAGGTVMRFLAAFVALGHGTFRLDGSERMRQRPIEDLLEGLRGLGVKAESARHNGCPPVHLVAAGLPGGPVSVAGSRSSQYVSALLLAAPYARTPLKLEVTGPFVSRPYVELTVRGMADFGITTVRTGERGFAPQQGCYRAGSYQIEGDASAASYFLAAPAILGGRCTVTNISARSAQGDARFAQVLERMGCTVRSGILPDGEGIEVSKAPGAPLKPLDIDMNDMPDVALTLAAVCLFAAGPTRIYNIANLRIKETDRLHALAQELRKLGAGINEGPDSLEITPRPIQPATIETYDDHRMAMALALVGLAHQGVTIKDPACVSKSYPRYFEDLEALRNSSHGLHG